MRSHQKAHGVKAVERKPLIGYESLLAWQAETARHYAKRLGHPGWRG